MVVKILDLCGMEEVAVVLNVAIHTFQDIVEVADIGLREKKITDLANKVTSTRDSINKGITNTEDKLKDVSSIFVRLESTVVEFGKPPHKDPQTIVHDFLDLEKHFEAIYTQYEAVKAALADPKKIGPTINEYLPKPGYGTISMGTFIALLHCEESVPDNQIQAFLEKYLASVHPTGGFAKLIAAIEFSKKGHF